ncbi:hypothetical protein DYB28_008662 [Aphanomyces astaci]|uniref:Uncharacterized protein n=1 Tax=Aphanomyces astaci TaxID=112090 RepID=A0A9X8HBU9_APHAT|nr:hypothetical protein DYB28_008662 [Aphanomyces astaci]
MEFQTLASLVRSLKEESCRHLQLETETQTEMEYLNAQATSTRKGLGKLAELLTDDLSVMRADLQHEMQAVQVDCINRVEELTAVVERLSFRFTHHIRGNYHALESRVASLSAALDTSRTQHQYAHETLETTTSLRLDALAGALELTLRAVLASSTAPISTTTTPVAKTKRVDVV